MAFSRGIIIRYKDVSELPPDFTGIATREVPYITRVGLVITDRNQIDSPYSVWYRGTMVGVRRTIPEAMDFYRDVLSERVPLD